MLPVLKIIHLVLVKKFYERHAGLLFAVFYVMFGMVESNQIISYHFGLILGAISSPVFLAVVLAVWLLYLSKSVLFLEECFSQPRNTFLRQLNLLDQQQQFLLLAYALLLCYLPVLIYSAFMIVIAFQQHYYLAALSMMAFHAVMLGAGAFKMVHSLNSSSPPFLQLPSFRWPFIKSYPLFYIGLLFDRFKITLLLTKVFSILCLIGFLRIPLDDYEPRLAYLGLAIANLSHAVILFEWRKLEDNYFLFMRALPVSILYRFAMVAVAFGLLLLPEFIVLLVQHIHLVDALTALLLAVGFSLYIYSTSFKGILDNDKLIQRILWMFLITFMLALSKLALPTAIVWMAIGWWRFRKNFDDYESSANIPA
jgi:hypothetical protein